MFPLLLIQIAIILAAARAAGALLRRLGQPGVAGEMLAGIALGPSLLGSIAPHAHRVLFPEDGMEALNAIGQLGLVIYMFVVGLTIDLRRLHEQRRLLILTSVSSMLVPFAAGLGLAPLLYTRLSVPGISRLAFALFLGACMSVTAFPVLVRILHETGMIHTRVGAVAVACAAVDDVGAWIMLAAILTFIKAPAQRRPLWMTSAMLAVYILLMLALPRVWNRLTGWRRERDHAGQLSRILLIAILSSAATEWIGIHTLFGPFLAGVVLTKTPALVESVRRMLEPLMLALFLPLFFALVGLRTRFDLVSGADAMPYTLIIFVTAVAGKWFGSALAARFMGMSWREANALGILMNTRGLVELVILNIGLELGVLSPALFSMMVIMALATTLMTLPLLRWAYPAELPQSIKSNPTQILRNRK